MNEHAQKRLTIVAAILTILSVIWYFLKPDKAAQVLVNGATVSPGGRVSDPVLFGDEGSPEQVAVSQDPTAAAVAAVTGTAGADGAAGAPGATAYLYSNLPPRHVARPERRGGCGCERPSCSSKATPTLFPDGRGACLSSTTSTLSDSMESCIPGYTQRALDNLMSNAAVYGGDFAWDA